jgi:hypothetical protein
MTHSDSRLEKLMQLHSSQAAQDRRARSRERPSHQNRHGVGLSRSSGLGARGLPSYRRGTPAAHLTRVAGTHRKGGIIFRPTEANSPLPRGASIAEGYVMAELQKKGVRVALLVLGLAIEVRDRVAEIALRAKDGAGNPAPHEQTPAYYDQLSRGRVYLVGLPKPNEPSKSDDAVGAPAVAPALDEVVWESLKGTTDVAALRGFVARYPGSRHRHEALAQIAMLESRIAEDRRKAEEERKKLGALPQPATPAPTPSTTVASAIGDCNQPCGSFTFPN